MHKKADLDFVAYSIKVENKYINYIVIDNTISENYNSADGLYKTYGEVFIRTLKVGG